MLDTAKRLGLATVCAALAVSLVLSGEVKVDAQGAYSANYCSATNQVFWFVHASDTHIGTSGSGDSDRLRWLVTTGKTVIAPLFTVVTGDLTDSTNGNIFGYPNGPYQSEWNEYRSILTTAGVRTDDYYDIPGNHDAYSDRYFNYYKGNAIQGAAFNGQLAWTKTLPEIGTYHFLGVNTPDNTGAAFSLSSPYGDHAGLDATELADMANDLDANATADLTFVFGHHPVSSTGNSSDTYLYYGAREFVAQLEASQVSAYNYGHAHDNVETQFTGNSYTGEMQGGGIRYSRVASLGKDSPNSYAVVSVDCNGVNSVTQPVGTWPLVLITAPVNRYVGSALNPYAYDVQALSSNPIRALVFDGGTIGEVRFRIDGGTTWYPMARVSGTPSRWAATWDASAVAAGEHAIEVQAVGTTTRSHTIKVNVTGAANRAPTAVNDSYTTLNTAALVVMAPGVLANDTDPEGTALVAALVDSPTKGTLTLKADGGFTYAPINGATGTDFFTYTASDGVLRSGSATVTITLTSPPTSDTVTIKTATYTLRTKTLLVQATSSAAPTAKLTLQGYGPMTYSSKTKLYAYQAKVAAAPASVTVNSDRGGTANLTVTRK